MLEIHDKNVKSLVFDNWKQIQERRLEFEAHKVMTDIVKDIQASLDEDQILEDDEDREQNENIDPSVVESTLDEEIIDFDKWAKKQAVKHLETVQQFTNLQDYSSLRKSISELNRQQRKIFDDIMEREISPLNEREPYFLFIGGEAGTGKSFLMRVLMEGVKHINIKAGTELNKPCHNRNGTYSQRCLYNQCKNH